MTDVPINPEAIINAAVAAKAAELASAQAFYAAVTIIGILLIIGAAIMFILYKVYELERNTNGMRIQLVEATRKLALVEGNIVGRSEQIEEQAGLTTRERKKESS